MKQQLNSVELAFANEDLLAIAERGADKYDFVSLSDVPSYFSEHLDRVYLQKLSKGLAPGALVVVRCYLRVPENTDLTGFADVTNEFHKEIAEEKTQMYRTFIYEYKG
jgi:S-adenosylmethionine-diacylglycerol 3-amino-3-carboxypropyl transferase